MTGEMNEHEMCCGTVADKAKLRAEIEQRDLIIAAQQRSIDALQIVEDARARVVGRTLKFAMERGYNPASDEDELEYIMRRFDDAEQIAAARLRRIDELVQARDAAEANAADLEEALEGVVSLLNNYSGYLSSCDETIHAEVTLERVYRIRQRAQEACDAPNP